MSTTDQFFGGTSEIGDLVTTTERGGQFTIKGKVFARCGTVYPAASYPSDGATDPNYGIMVNGIATTLPASIAATGWATNGAGTTVVAYGDATNVLVTTNNFQSYALVAHGQVAPVTDVVWHSGLGKFIGFGNSATTIYSTSSTTGSSGWAAGGSSACTSATVNTARAACDGTTAVVAVQTTTAAGSIATMTAVATLTARTPAAAPGGGNLFMAVLPSLGATRWLLVSSGATCLQSSAADGSTWTSQGSGLATLTVAGLAAGNGLFLIFDSASPTNVYYTSTTGASGSWTQRALPGMQATGLNDSFFIPASTANWCRYDGANFVTGTAAYSATNVCGLFGYSSDGLDWKVRQLTNTGPVNSPLLVMSANGSLGTVPSKTASTSGAQYSASWLTACDYVGKARPVYRQPNGSSLANNQSMFTPDYVRIK